MSREGGTTLSLLLEGRTNVSRAGSRRSDLDREAFARVFGLLDLLAGWCYDRSDRIGACYIEQAPDGLALYLVGKNPAFDFELNQEVADLTLMLVDKGFPVYATLVPASAPVHADGFKEGHIVYQLQMR